MTDEIVRKHLEGDIITRNEKFEYKGENYIGAIFELRIPIEENRNP